MNQRIYSNLSGAHKKNFNARGQQTTAQYVNFSTFYRRKYHVAIYQSVNVEYTHRVLRNETGNRQFYRNILPLSCVIYCRFLCRIRKFSLSLLLYDSQCIEKKLRVSALNFLTSGLLAYDEYCGLDCGIQYNSHAFLLVQNKTWSSSPHCKIAKKSTIALPLLLGHVRK